MKGTFNGNLVAENRSLNFGIAAAIRGCVGQSVTFKVVTNWESVDKDGRQTGKAYNALQPCNAAGQPLIEGFALSKWDLNPTPRITRDAAGKLTQFPVTGNRLYATAQAQMRSGITEVEWLQAIATSLNGSVVEPLEYVAVKKDGGTYNNALFGVK